MIWCSRTVLPALGVIAMPTPSQRWGVWQSGLRYIEPQVTVQIRAQSFQHLCHARVLIQLGPAHSARKTS